MKSLKTLSLALFFVVASLFAKAQTVTASFLEKSGSDVTAYVQYSGTFYNPITGAPNPDLSVTFEIQAYQVGRGTVTLYETWTMIYDGQAGPTQPQYVAYQQPIGGGTVIQSWSVINTTVLY